MAQLLALARYVVEPKHLYLRDFMVLGMNYYEVTL